MFGRVFLRLAGDACYWPHPNQERFRAGWLRFLARLVEDFEACFDFTLLFRFAVAFGRTRSGSSAFPAPRFHSSKVWGEILPSTSNSANFLRCALLLIGICSLVANVPISRPQGVGT